MDGSLVNFVFHTPSMVEHTKPLFANNFSWITRCDSDQRLTWVRMLFLSELKINVF